MEFSIIASAKKCGKDGKKKYRLVVDYRKLNEATIKQVYPIPRIDEILDQLECYIIFLAIGYHQILMDENEKEKTAFSSALGHFEFNRMPFGLTGAPATFQRIMNHVLTGLQGIDCFVYLDDMYMVYGSNLEQHGKKLMKVFEALRENNLKLNISKRQFLGRE